MTKNTLHILKNTKKAMNFLQKNFIIIKPLPIKSVYIKKHNIKKNSVLFEIIV